MQSQTLNRPHVDDEVLDQVREDEIAEIIAALRDRDDEPNFLWAGNDTTLPPSARARKLRRENPSSFTGFGHSPSDDAAPARQAEDAEPHPLPPATNRAVHSFRIASAHRRLLPLCPGCNRRGTVRERRTSLCNDCYLVPVIYYRKYCIAKGARRHR